MIIKFSVDDIKNMNLLYTWTEAEEFGVKRTEEHYHGTEYCKSIVDDINEHFIDWFSEYKGQINKVANETFILSKDDKNFDLSFGINTYDHELARMECTIKTSDQEKYDKELEKLKIALKNRLINDWNKCTWLIDEQSEMLCRNLFQIAYRVENDLRAFASKILIHFLGVNWISSFGLEKYAESVNSLKEAFVQRVPEFDNINTDFQSMTLETLVDIILNGIVYNDSVTLNKQDYFKLQEMGRNNAVKAINAAEFIKKKRSISKKIWDDFFLKNFTNPDDFKSLAHNFISGRNHIAHSKILSFSAYQKIESDFNSFDNIIKNAEIKFENEEASEETIATWLAEEDILQQEAEQEQFEASYYKDRLSSETGMDILDEDEILEWFDEVIYKLYDAIYQRYNLDDCYELSDLSLPSESGKSFYVSCPAVKDGTAKIEIATIYSIDDYMGGDSFCNITCNDINGSKLFEAEIRFHNGNGYENDDGVMEPDESTEYDDREIELFKKSLIECIDNLNPYPALLDTLTCENKGSVAYVADFPCEQCGKNGISINESFLPLGHCCYCGYENELVECQKCGELVSAYEAEGELCSSCLAYIEDQ